MKTVLLILLVLFCHFSFGQWLPSCDNVMRYQHLRYQHGVYLGKTIGEVYSGISYPIGIWRIRHDDDYEILEFYYRIQKERVDVSFWIKKNGDYRDIEEFVFCHKEDKIEIIQILVYSDYDEDGREIRQGCFLRIPDYE